MFSDHQATLLLPSNDYIKRCRERAPSPAVPTPKPHSGASGLQPWPLTPGFQQHGPGSGSEDSGNGAPAAHDPGWPLGSEAEGGSSRLHLSLSLTSMLKKKKNSPRKGKERAPSSAGSICPELCRHQPDPRAARARASLLPRGFLPGSGSQGVGAGDETGEARDSAPATRSGQHGAAPATGTR